METLIICLKCLALLPTACFYVSDLRPNGFRSRCICCEQERNHFLREERQVQDANDSARAYESAGYLTVQLWRERKMLFGSACARCGKHEQSEILFLDHIKPLSKQGDNMAENIQPLCCGCSSIKGTKTIAYRPRAVTQPSFWSIRPARGCRNCPVTERRGFSSCPFHW